MKMTKEAIEFAFPQKWCAPICRNAMNEICVTSCSLKRDTSGFQEKEGLTLDDMPAMPKQEDLKTPAEKFTVVYVYLSKLVDCQKGIPNAPTYATYRGSDFDTQTSVPISPTITLKSLLPVIQEKTTVFENRQVGSSEKVGSD